MTSTTGWPGWLADHNRTALVTLLARTVPTEVLRQALARSENQRTLDLPSEGACKPGWVPCATVPSAHGAYPLDARQDSKKNPVQPGLCPGPLGSCRARGGRSHTSGRPPHQPQVWLGLIEFVPRDTSLRYRTDQRIWTTPVHWEAEIKARELSFSGRQDIIPMLEDYFARFDYSAYHPTSRAELSASIQP